MRGHGRRFGGLRLLRLAGGAAALVLGGVIAAGLAATLVLALAVAGIAFAAVGGVLLYAWIVAGWLIYRTIRSQFAPRTRLARAAGLRSAATASDGARSVSLSILAILAGLVLTVVAGIALGQMQLPSAASLLLPPIIGGVLGLGVHGLLRIALGSGAQAERPPRREVRAQVKRIRRKASRLGRDAARIGGVFRDLQWQAEEMARRAAELAERLFELRRVARGVARDHDSAAGVAAREADTSQQRLIELLARNRQSQQCCLEQMARIERLLDLASLEISSPLPQAREGQAAEVARDFEEELDAIRLALEEVSRQVQS